MATTTNKIKKIGNGHFLPLSAATLESLNLRAGQEVTLTTDEDELIVRAVDDTYDSTREAASRIAARYRRTLIMLGREG
ncbi:AbrB/MazE/SpoVT family DNA-binding domain-containing protein [Alkalilacustris brevis]|uniref:AbrB/MazE/SpoVT family DNA-binding domain-containing protein n=1 Tax=Alkalilacustris brevis TaxID=2026338 RepID=UPI000E0D2F4E|nr:AbrB/MazE/SpoVT family DNA-binding domain-containing protein [Alkalilacustris brevis]